MPRLQTGQLVHIGRPASVQFAGRNAFNAQIIRVHDWPTYIGWVWLDVYQLNRAGAAVERRSIFVIIAGVQVLPDRPPASRTHRDQVPEVRTQRTRSGGRRSFR